MYTFKIRKGIMWSDGVPITARTVYDSWLRILDPATAAEYASIMNDIIKGRPRTTTQGKAGPDKVAMKVVDLQTFQFTCVGPVPLRPVRADAPGVRTSCRCTRSRSTGADWTQPENFVGNGPVRAARSGRRTTRSSCVKNPKYWDAKNVQLDQIVFYPRDDNAVNYKMYVNGEVDWNTNSPPADKIDEAVARPQKDFLRTPILSVYYYEFNVNKPPFNDLRVRKAFSLSVGRKNIVEQITKTGEIPTTNYIPPMGGYTPSRRAYPRTSRQAKKLLADAGFPGGKGFPKLKLGYNTSATAQVDRGVHAAAVGAGPRRQDRAREHGLRDVPRRAQGREPRRLRHRPGGLGGRLHGPLQLPVHVPLDNKSISTTPGGRTRSTTSWSSKTNTLPAGPERNKLFFDAEKLLVEDLPIIPFFFYTSQNMIDLNKWGGWSSNALDRHSPKFIFKK